MNLHKICPECGNEVECLRYCPKCQHDFGPADVEDAQLECAEKNMVLIPKVLFGVGVLPCVVLGVIAYFIMDSYGHNIESWDALWQFVKWSCFWLGTYNFVVTGVLCAWGMSLYPKRRMDAFWSVLVGIAIVRVVDLIVMLCR